jgi:hypothetical protein
MQHACLYTDAKGESHFKEIHFELKPSEFAPPAPPLNVSSSVPARQILFVSAPVGWEGDWHPSPARQYLMLIAGELEIQASDGEVRVFKKGDVVLATDTTGVGHISRSLGPEELETVIVQLPG